METGSLNTRILEDEEEDNRGYQYSGYEYRDNLEKELYCIYPSADVQAMGHLAKVRALQTSQYMGEYRF
jgi:hypothetical protein